MRRRRSPPSDEGDRRRDDAAVELRGVLELVRGHLRLLRHDRQPDRRRARGSRAPSTSAAVAAGRSSTVPVFPGTTSIRRPRRTSRASRGGRSIAVAEQAHLVVDRRVVDVRRGRDSRPARSGARAAGSREGSRSRRPGGAPLRPRRAQSAVTSERPWAGSASAGPPAAKVTGTSGHARGPLARAAPAASAAVIPPTSTPRDLRARRSSSGEPAKAYPTPMATTAAAPSDDRGARPSGPYTRHGGEAVRPSS